MVEKTKVGGLFPYLLLTSTYIFSSYSIFAQSDGEKKHIMRDFPKDKIVELLPEKYKYLEEVVNDPEMEFTHEFYIDVSDTLIKSIFHNDSVGLPFASKFLNVLLGVEEYKATNFGDSTQICVYSVDSEDSTKTDTLDVGVNLLYRENGCYLFRGIGVKTTFAGDMNGEGVVFIKTKRLPCDVAPYLESSSKDILGIHLQANVEVDGSNIGASALKSFSYVLGAIDDFFTSDEAQAKQDAKDAESIHKHTKKISDVLKSEAVKEKIYQAYCNGKLDVSETKLALELVRINKESYAK